MLFCLLQRKCDIVLSSSVSFSPGSTCSFENEMCIVGTWHGCMGDSSGEGMTLETGNILVL